MLASMRAPRINLSGNASINFPVVRRSGRDAAMPGMKIAIVTGSTRPRRNAIAVARWVLEIAATRSDAQFELVDIADYGLPLLDEPVNPAAGHYSRPHTRRWAAKIAEFDGYVFVTPEYNHGVSAALKNAIDYLYAEWNNKAAGFVGYGGSGAARSVECLRQVMGALMVADVSAQVSLSIFSDFDGSAFRPHSRHEARLHQVLDQVIAWAGALKSLRLTSRD